ncbi:MAG: Lrp/AsnC family transcriptional regulator [Coriobacteriia bacterium]|nr:Lrp/AsnC family transcriptional regulator [Coriobacteriia bacterium]
MRKPITALDKKLIGLFAADGRLPLAEAASMAGVSRPTVTSRVKALVDGGVLRFAALVDASRAGGLTVGLVGVKLDGHRLEETVTRIADLDDVSWAAVVTGRYDIIAQIVTEGGMDGLYDFVNTGLDSVGGIASSEMFVVMKATGKWSSLPPGLLREWGAPADANA